MFNVPDAKWAKIRQVPIMWTDDDEKVILYPYEDALVISADMENKRFDHIFVSSVDVLFKSTLDETGISGLRLENTNTSLKRFGGGRLTPLGVVKLPF